MDRVLFLVTDGAHLINLFADNVHDAAKGLATDRHNDLLAGVQNLLTANETVSTVHGDGTDCIFAEMLGNFKNQVHLAIINGRVGDLQGVVNRGEFPRLKFDVNNSADYLGDLSKILTHYYPF